jgi:hypothetical protein
VKRHLVLGGFVLALCLFGLRRHFVTRAGPMGGYRCQKCRRVFGSLSEVDGMGAGYVSPNHLTFSRHGAGGHAEMTRDTWEEAS